MPGPQHDPRPEGKCERTPPCAKRGGGRCDDCKRLWAWYMREWRRNNPEKARENDRKDAERKRASGYRTEYNRRYSLEKREQIRAQRSEKYWSDPEAARAKARRYYYKTKYGITPEQREALLEGVCPICLIRPKEHIDHDHELGHVRGGLCMTCNTHVGWLETVGIEAVLNYLSGSEVGE